MCGEYGDKLGRPHYHALLFGHDFKDKKLWEVIRKNEFYRSATLEKLWPFGYSNISDVNFKSAAYVARYVMKKITGDQAEDHYTRIDKDTGEIQPIQPEYNNMSLKPGIASGWFSKYEKDVFPSDKLIMNGRQTKTPRYYLKQLEAVSPGTYEIVKENRRQKSRHLANQTIEQLDKQHYIKKLHIKKLKRELT